MAVLPTRIQPARARRAGGGAADAEDAAVQSAFAPADERTVTRALPVVLSDQPSVAATASATPLAPAFWKACWALSADVEHAALAAASPIPVPDWTRADQATHLPRPRLGLAEAPPVEDTSDAAFERRHFRHERAEKRIRRQETERVRADRTRLATRIEQMRTTPLASLAPLLANRKHQQHHAFLLFGLVPPSDFNLAAVTPSSASPHLPSADSVASDSLPSHDRAGDTARHDGGDDGLPDPSNPETAQQLRELKSDMLHQAEHALERHDALLAVPPPVMSGKVTDETGTTTVDGYHADANAPPAERNSKRQRLNASTSTSGNKAGIDTRRARAQRIRVALSAPRRGGDGRGRAPAHVARNQRTVASIRSAALERERARVHMSGRTQLGSQTTSSGKVEVVYQEQGAHNIHARTSGGRFASKPKTAAAPPKKDDSSLQQFDKSGKPSGRNTGPRKKLRTTLKVLPVRKTPSQPAPASMPPTASSVRSLARKRGHRRSEQGRTSRIQAQVQAYADAAAEAARKNPGSAEMQAAAEAAAAEAARKVAQLRSQAQTLGQRRTAAATAAAAARAALRRELNLQRGQPIPPQLLKARLQAVRASVSAASAATRPGLPTSPGEAAPETNPPPFSDTARKRSSSHTSADNYTHKPRRSTLVLRTRNRARATYHEASDSDVDLDGDQGNNSVYPEASNISNNMTDAERDPQESESETEHSLDPEHQPEPGPESGNASDPFKRNYELKRGREHEPEVPTSRSGRPLRSAARKTMPSQPVTRSSPVSTRATKARSSAPQAFATTTDLTAPPVSEHSSASKTISRIHGRTSRGRFASKASLKRDSGSSSGGGPVRASRQQTVLSTTPADTALMGTTTRRTRLQASPSHSGSTTVTRRSLRSAVSSSPPAPASVPAPISTSALLSPAPAPTPAPAPATRRVKLTFKRGPGSDASVDRSHSQVQTQAQEKTSLTPAEKLEHSNVPVQAAAPAQAETQAPAKTSASSGKGRSKGHHASQPAYVPSSLTEDEAMAMLQAALADDPDALDLLGAPGAGGPHSDGKPREQGSAHRPEFPREQTVKVEPDASPVEERSALSYAH